MTGSSNLGVGEGDTIEEGNAMEEGNTGDRCDSKKNDDVESADVADPDTSDGVSGREIGLLNNRPEGVGGMIRRGRAGRFSSMASDLIFLVLGRSERGITKLNKERKRETYKSLPQSQPLPLIHPKFLKFDPV